MKNLIRISFLICFGHIAFAQDIVLDACFDDWDQITQVLDIEGNDGNLDLLSLSITNVESTIYFLLETKQELKFNDHNFANKGVKLFVDADNDNNTGTMVDGMGVDLEIDFGERFFKVYHPEVASWERSLNDIDFKINPSTSGTQFEFAISSDYVPFNEIRIFNGNSFKVIFESSSGDLMPNIPQAYAFQNTSFNYQHGSLKKDKAYALRLMSYNTLNEGLDDPSRLEHFRRIIRSISPDIITFNESDVSANYVEILLEDWMDEVWYAQGSSNSRNITASRYPIIEEYALSGRMIASLIDLPDHSYSTDFLSVNLHAQCCNNDFERQIEADRFVNFIKDVKNGVYPEIAQNTPFVISGDFNFVGDEQQLITLLDGDIINNNDFGNDEMPDWDLSSLENAKCLNLTKPNNLTWYNYSSSWPPGKLDFILYSNSVMELEKSFTFQTNHLDQGTLIDNNLQSNDTQMASDHLPIVADFKLQHSVSTTEANNYHPKAIFNQVNKELFISNLIREGKILIYNQIGQKQLQLELEVNKSTKLIALNNLTAGMYFLHLDSIPKFSYKFVIIGN